jgi:phosphoribosyl-ATP pyrophosphohydrolase/phosphoribosyl-AMP cyclohydrolase
MNIQVNEVRFDQQGLVPTIVQDARTREVLMLAFMNKESLERTLETRETWFWSRSRSQLWHKGETSGNTQHVNEVRKDCDSDALLVLVETAGPACHTGARSCFYRDLDNAEIDQTGRGSKEVLNELYTLLESRREHRPAGSYTTYLFDQGIDKILKKVGEESAETIIAAKNEDKAQLVHEVADLAYHLMVLMVERGITIDDVGEELGARALRPARKRND